MSSQAKESIKQLGLVAYESIRKKKCPFLKTLHGSRQYNTLSNLDVSQCYISSPLFENLSYAPAHELLFHHDALNFLSNKKHKQQHQQQ